MIRRTPLFSSPWPESNFLSIPINSTYTLGAARRAGYAAEIGADAIQVAVPFWMEIGDDQVVPFFKEVAAAAGGMAVSVYETTRAKKALTLDQHRAIKDIVPNYLMVKANEHTLGFSPEGCKALSAFVNVFVGENQLADLGRCGAIGSCSSVVYYNPRFMLAAWGKMKAQNWEGLGEDCRRLDALFEFYFSQFGDRAFTDTAFDRLGGVAGGFLETSLYGRGPYPSPTPEDVETLRAWYRDNFPEMLTL